MCTRRARPPARRRTGEPSAYLLLCVEGGGGGGGGDGDGDDDGGDGDGDGGKQLRGGGGARAVCSESRPGERCAPFARAAS
jgi:hypothetical protein